MQGNNIIKLWHTNKKIFINEFSILQTINSEGEFEHTYFERNPKTLQLERLSTCQIKELKCTGLKDKSGRLIFEGDILEETYVSEGKTYTKITFVDFDIELSAYCFRYDKENKVKPVYVFELNKGEEEKNFGVIGNIYENPELFKECE